MSGPDADAVAEGYFGAWKANDWETLRGLLADDVSVRAAGSQRSRSRSTPVRWPHPAADVYRFATSGTRCPWRPADSSRPPSWTWGRRAAQAAGRLKAPYLPRTRAADRTRATW